MRKEIAKLADGLRLEITETVNLDGKPQIEVYQTTHNRIGGAPVDVEVGVYTRAEAERFAWALLRSVRTSRKKHRPRSRRA